MELKDFLAYMEKVFNILLNIFFHLIGSFSV